MIHNKNTIYAKVWKATLSESGKYIDLQISTSEKGEDGEYINSAWFPRAIGHAVNALKNIKEGDRIEITSCKFTNERKELDDGTKKSFFRFIIFEAKIVSDGNNNEKPAATETAAAKPKSKPAAKPAKTTNEEEDPF